MRCGAYDRHFTRSAAQPASTEGPERGSALRPVALCFCSAGASDRQRIRTSTARARSPLRLLQRLAAKIGRGIWPAGPGQGHMTGTPGHAAGDGAPGRHGGGIRPAAVGHSAGTAGASDRQARGFRPALAGGIRPAPGAPGRRRHSPFPFRIKRLDLARHTALPRSDRLIKRSILLPPTSWRVDPDHTPLDPRDGYRADTRLRV
jgi:hypothetical protein